MSLGVRGAQRPEPDPHQQKPKGGRLWLASLSDPDRTTRQDLHWPTPTLHAEGCTTCVLRKHAWQRQQVEAETHPLSDPQG